MLLCCDPVRQFLFVSTLNYRPWWKTRLSFASYQCTRSCKKGVQFANGDSISFLIIDAKAERAIHVGGKHIRVHPFGGRRFNYLLGRYSASTCRDEHFDGLACPVWGGMERSEFILEKVNSVLDYIDTPQVLVSYTLQFF